mmetsp:Transcript_40096/g.84092  ORF Transcript_40096/g.84092 Transcript_40096/m.84092 type:complete len:397 (-) Transcript_40096:598-1788(-)
MICALVFLWHLLCVESGLRLLCRMRLCVRGILSARLAQHGGQLLRAEEPRGVAQRERVGGGEEVEVLVARERDALEHDERARDQRKVLGHRKREIEKDLVELARDGAELRAARRHVCARLAAAFRRNAAARDATRRAHRACACEVLLCGELALVENVRQRRQQLGPVDVARQEAQRNCVLHQSRHVAAHQMHQRGGERARVESIDLGAETEVDEHEPARRVDEQVAWMRVGVEVSDDEELCEEAVDANRDECIDRRRGRLGKLLALDPFAHENLARGEVVVALWDVHLAVEHRQERVCEALHVGRLVPVVELEKRGACERVEEVHVECAALGRAKQPGKYLLLEPLHRGHVPAQQVQVARDCAHHVWPLHLQRNLLIAALEPALEDLSERGGSDWR